MDAIKYKNAPFFNALIKKKLNYKQGIFITWNLNFTFIEWTLKFV